MRILYLCGFYPEIGGPFYVSKTLLEKLSEKGVEIKVLSPIPTNYSRNKIDFLNALPFEIRYLKTQLPRWIMPSFSTKFLNEIKKDNSDVVHLLGVFDFYAAALSVSDKRIVFSPHGTFMKEAYNMKKLKQVKKNIYMKIVGKKILDKSSKIHLITEEERNHFLSFYPEFQNKTVVIPNGLNLSGYEIKIKKTSFSDKYTMLKEKKIVLYLSRLNWTKGIDILIKGFSMAHKERKDIMLVMAGKDDGDGYEKKVRKWVEEEGIKEVVLFTGMLTGKDKLMALYGSNIFILPSYSENFGMAIIEAMACGLPVVVSNKVGIVREIKQWQSGIIIEPTVDGVYQGLKACLEMESYKRQEMIDRARKMVEVLYDIDKVSNRMIELYQEVISNG